MKRGIQALLVLFGIGFSNLDFAGQVTWIPPSTVKWTGDLELTEWRAFKNLLDDHPVTHLALVDSNGGTKTVVAWVINAIRERRLSVSAKGICNSACALAFLASSDRVMLPSGTDSPTKIGIHGYFNRTTLESAIPTEQEIAFVMDATAGKMPRKLVELILHTKSSRGGLMIYESPVTTEKGKTSVLFCDTKDDNSGFACAPLQGADAVSLGIVTPLVKDK